MTDPNTPDTTERPDEIPTGRPEEVPHFDTNEVQANRAIEQGLGIGARELSAQREHGEDASAETEVDDLDIKAD